MHFKRVFRNAGIAGLGIVFSRLLGFVRDILFASLLGTGEIAQAFFVAFRIPNLFRDILAEGAANSSIIPVLSEYKKKSLPQEYHEILDSLKATMLLTLLFFVLMGMLFAPYIVMLIAPGFKQNPVLFDMTVFMTRAMFPFLFFVGMFGVNMGILHTEERFISTAVGQPLFNTVMILTLSYMYFTKNISIYLLIIGVLIGGLALILGQVLELNKIGYRAISFRFGLHPAVVKMGKLLFPRLMGTVIYQINIFADTILASLTNIVGEGGIPAIYYANRLMQFPLAIFSVSVAQAMLPRLSHLYGDKDEVRKTFAMVLELVLFLIIPSAVFLMAENKLIVSVLFKRGAFDDYSVLITSKVLFYYALGLVFFAGIKMLVSAFHSMQDTRTPVRTAKVSLVVNVVLNVILMFPMKISGLALASAIAGAVNFFLLFSIMNKRIRFVDREFLIEIIKIAASGCIVWLILKWQSESLSIYSLKALFRAMLLAAGGYLIGCGVFRIRIWGMLINSAVKRVFLGR